VATLAIPGTILGESSLSFLGIGITPPLTSWGVMLKDAQNVQALVHHLWLAIPGLMIILVVLCYNFFGDGLRDAADPFAT
jgi:peptide/nickel transport system permease protein